MSDDYYDTRTITRGPPPAVSLRLDEAHENRLLVQAAWILFLAIFGIGLVVYVALNVMAAEVTWIWYAIVYVALGAASWMLGVKVAEFFDTDQYYHIVAGVAAVLVWGFLSLDGESWGLPTGQIARFMISALDFPEGGELGAVVTSVFRAVAVGVLPIAGIVTLWILRGRMLDEIKDRFHANPDLRKYEMELEHKREQDGKVGELRAELDHMQEERDKALEELARIRQYPPVSLLWAGVGSDDAPRVRGIDDTETFIRFVVDVLERGRSAARAAWVGHEAVKEHGWVVSKAQWHSYSSLLYQRRWLDRNGKPTVTADQALAELGLSREGYVGDEVTGDA